MDVFGITLPGYGWETVLGSAISGVFLGSVYALVALGLTLIYGVLHIINFAHGSLLMLAMYAVYFLWWGLGLDPYLTLLIVVPGGFLFGYGLQRGVIGKLSHGRDEIILLVTLGLAIILDNAALFAFSADERLVQVPYDLDGLDLGVTYAVYPELAALCGSLLVTLLLWVFMSRSDTGKAIRAVAKERQGARLVGINVEHIFAVSFGIGGSGDSGGDGGQVHVESQSSIATLGDKAHAIRARSLGGGGGDVIDVLGADGIEGRQLVEVEKRIHPPPR